MSKVNEIKIGTYVLQKEGWKSFVPTVFPPEDGFVISPKLYKKHEEAIRLVGKLDGIMRLLPDKDFFLHMFVRKDAALSSQIEGTQATLQDAIAAPVTEEKSQLHPDVDDILHYVAAVGYGLERSKELPISLRLIREIHQQLMVGARATQHAYPGEFRHSQNWIGGRTPHDASFVPPSPSDMQTALDDLEAFIHADDDYPSLVKAGLIHAQFETIHPFTDGNGRTGRMLVSMYIHHLQLLEYPVLYLAGYFKKHQKLYYQKLQTYHDDADVDGWLSFFLDGVAETADSAINTCASITVLRDRDFAKIQKLGKTSATSTLEVVHKLFGQPIVGIAEIVRWTNFSKQGAYNVIERLVSLGILEPIGNADYGQKYMYADYYELFDENFRDARKKFKKETERM